MCIRVFGFIYKIQFPLTSLPSLVAVQLGDEEGVKEVLVVCLIVVEVSVVILTGLVVGHRIVRSDEAALQIFLTVSHGQ